MQKNESTKPEITRLSHRSEIIWEELPQYDAQWRNWQGQKGEPLNVNTGPLLRLYFDFRILLVFK